MSLKNYIFTSESVSEGHPDKVCDRISDEIVDQFFKADPMAKVACETLVTTNLIVLAGEVRMSKKAAGPSQIMSKTGKVNKALAEKLARKAVKDIGYAQKGFHWKTAKVQVHLHGQSADIAQGVEAAGNKDEGAGDQGIMFGYATNETPELMPAPLQYSHNVLKLMAEARHSGTQKLFEPDAKSQFTLQYENGKPVKCTAVVVSTQHKEKDGKKVLESEDIKELVLPYVKKVLPEGWMPPLDQVYVNPTGRFVIGGPDGDTGLTGRKIIVDTYGGAAPHGGGAFSGKDPSKVDRSAAYAARYLAKNVVAAGLADRCTIQLSYAIGVAHPLSVYVNTDGTGKADEQKIAKILQELMSLTPRGIRTHLKLNKPIYARTAAYGHFGRQPDKDGGFSWEKTDLADQLRKAF
ncbi:MAG: methionine adenosyltransferase [Xanthobacteraceae bacterium]|nr:methionine adenosyltransferase [Xanthobacteraceae bacterium]MBX3534002.1 methionine adenosyltransferase [Xanthobacteraceae bacterium]MCW5673347.1 methionine adenosyltransferase [Xanthobacteraceae bacterium]MCW5677543.1 methionine adenosyltransferase [Xanthobacteraceae bacterium]